MSVSLISMDDSDSDQSMKIGASVFEFFAHLELQQLDLN